MPPMIDWLISWTKLVFRFGKKFFKSARNIIEKFKTSGIIKFSKSIKNIIIKIKLKIHKNTKVNKLLKLKKIIKKVIPVISSAIKYLEDIFLLQFLHFIFKIKKETRGKLSYQFIFFLHFGQNDLPIITCLFFGNLWIQTFAKLPKTIPRKKTRNEFNKIKCLSELLN